MIAGEIISCLENAEALRCVDLNELSVTLDIFVLTLPLEIEVMADFHHNRSAKKHKSTGLQEKRISQSLLDTMWSFLIYKQKFCEGAKMHCVCH